MRDFHHSTNRPFRRRPRAAALAASAAVVLGAGAALAQAGDVTESSRQETQPPFSGEANVAYAEAVWSALADARIAGEGAVITFPYTGRDPHGTVLEYLEDEVPIDGETRLVISKRNHVGEGLAVQDVLAEPRAHLDSVTVMVRREEGYDPENQNWWWGKFNPDGSLQSNPQGMALAGRVAKGADQGCIACHSAAPGDDYVFSHDRF